VREMTVGGKNLAVESMRLAYGANRKTRRPKDVATQQSIPTFLKRSERHNISNTPEHSRTALFTVVHA